MTSTPHDTRELRGRGSSPPVTKFYLDKRPVLPCGTGLGPAIGAMSPEGQP